MRNLRIQWICLSVRCSKKRNSKVCLHKIILRTLLVTLRAKIYLRMIAHWCLVYWPEDDAVTLVRESCIVSPAKERLNKGAICKVKEKKNVHEGKILGIG